MYWLPKMVRSRGAVSPRPRATASSTPVMMPGMAAGTTTRRAMVALRAPRARAASLRWLGTPRMAVSPARMITGSMMIPMAKAPARPL